MIKKYQVFISSTFKDLVEERQEVLRSVLDLGHIPSGMEIFPAADVEQFKYLQQVIDECDYYILIIGARYGSTDSAGVSFTEKEYDYAVQTNKTVLVFIHADPRSLPVFKVDTDHELAKKLTIFRDKVSNGRLVQSWTSPWDLKAKVVVALSKAFNDAPGVGWVRGNVAASEDLLIQVNGLRNQLDALQHRNVELERLLGPDTSGLADFNDNFSVRYTYSAQTNRGFVDHSATEQLNWRDIFIAIGPGLMQPRALGHLAATLLNYLKENRGINKRATTIFDSDLATIKIQLVALGVVESLTAETTGGGMAEFLSLTAHGRLRLVEEMAIKKAKASA